MGLRGVERDIESFNAYIRCLTKDRQIEAAMNVLNHMRSPPLVMRVRSRHTSLPHLPFMARCARSPCAPLVLPFIRQTFLASLRPSNAPTSQVRGTLSEAFILGAFILRDRRVGVPPTVETFNLLIIATSLAPQWHPVNALLTDEVHARPCPSVELPRRAFLCRPWSSGPHSFDDHSFFFLSRGVVRPVPSEAL